MLRKHFGRRRFLKGLGGAVIGLPALDVFQSPVWAQSAAPTKKIYSALLMQHNGSVIGTNGEADRFWPTSIGPLTTAILAGADSTQAISEMKDYASKIVAIRNVDFKYSGDHNGGPPAGSCGSPIRQGGVQTMPATESIDFFIASKLTPGKEPLNTYAGRKGTYRDDAVSFSTGGQLRVADNNPQNIYMRLSGLTGVMQTDPALFARIRDRRVSVNDLVRNDLKDLLARTDLSAIDRQRLDLHLSSVRDMEVNMNTTLGPMLDTAGMTAVNGQHTTDANMEKVVNMMSDLIAFAFASDRARSATLQIGGTNDHTKYMIAGVQAPPYHFISHRVQSDGGSGTPIANAVELHHQIDRIHARYMKHFMDRMSAYPMPDGGTLLDASCNLWVNSCADGPPHGRKGIPHILMGGAGGYIKTGQTVKSPGPSHRVLNTIISAVGIRKANGDPYDTFGDPGSPGVVSEIIA
ncbi:MAG TPA: DUF1552 domain-containing protein [Polyangia bacterium]|nr:DUF1552 domain-containing protein [Polyangia bacterium]